MLQPWGCKVAFIAFESLLISQLRLKHCRRSFIYPEIHFTMFAQDNNLFAQDNKYHRTGLYGL